MTPPQAMAQTYDAFISYRHAEPDMSWVRSVLVPELRRKGVKVCLDVDDFVPGERLVDQMEAAVLHSRYTIAVVSRAYLEGRFASFESVMADLDGVEQDQSRLLAVALEPCESELRQRAGLWLDLPTLGLPAIIAALLGELSGREAR
jgi:hypothetical protein